MATHFYLLLSLAALQGIAAVRFVVDNDVPTSPGGTRFTNEIGVDYAVKTMETTTNYVWNMFEEPTEADRKPVDQVTLFIAVLINASAVTSGSNINVSSIHLEDYKGDLKADFTALLYHEMTHVWQWFGGDQYKALKNRTGLIEGIADYTVLMALGGYPTGFAKPGVGDRWDQGYDVTARFLEYLEGLRPGFVAALNKLMKDDYSDDFFNQLLGKSVDDLWKEYKAKYSNGTVSGQKTKLRSAGGHRYRFT